MRLIIPLTAGYLLDLLLGDPAGWPHPVRWFGWIIGRAEAWLNRGKALFLKGAAMTILLCGIIFIFFWYLSGLLWTWHPIVWYLFSSLFVFYGLANRQLVEEGRQVFTVLDSQGIEAGRRQLSRIVGRDTAALDPRHIRIAVMETLSENLSDGVIAPLFYYACAGVPGMMTYKMINTLDSMIGYKNEPYRLFGRFAARLDDVVNFIPARLTALLMVMVAASGRGLRFIFKYGHAHASPNSGYPEAALAGILHCRFGGANTYHGVIVQKPYIGHQERLIGHEEFAKVTYINHATTLVMIVIVIARLCA